MGKWGGMKRRKLMDRGRGMERKKSQARVREKEEVKSKASLPAICSSAFDNLGCLCHYSSLKEAETPHLPFIPFLFRHLKPFAFCQFYLSLSFLHVPLHFLNDNILAISTLARHWPGHNATCIQRRGNIVGFSKCSLFSLRF